MLWWHFQSNLSEKVFLGENIGTRQTHVIKQKCSGNDELNDEMDGQGPIFSTRKLGWLKPYRGLPKVLISISIVIFPISYAPRVSPSEKY